MALEKQSSIYKQFKTSKKLYHKLQVIQIIIHSPKMIDGIPEYDKNSWGKDVILINLRDYAISMDLI